MAAAKPMTSMSTEKRKAKESIPSRSVKSALSTKYVQDSDESNEEVGSKPKKKNLNVPKTKTATLRAPASTQPARPAVSSTIVSKRRKTSSPSPVRSMPSRNRIAKNHQSQTSPENDSQIDVPSRDWLPAPAKQRSQPSQSAQGTLKRSRNSPTPKRKPEPITPNAEYTGAKSKSSEDSSEDIGSESSEKGSGSSSDSSSESETYGSENPSQKSSTKGSPKRKEPLSHPVRPCKPPPGFEPATISIHPSSEMSLILEPSNLRGKQIWHIMAPASVPITAVKEVSMESIQDGASILSYKGAEYGFAPQPRVGKVSEHTLILPTAQSNDYRSSKTSVTQSLHLQQLVNLPNRAFKPSDLPNLTKSRCQTHVKVPRQQPQGLKMRYHPFGASSDDAGSDASETASPKVAELRTPQPVDSVSTNRRNHSAVDSDEHGTQTSSAKKRKRKPLHEDHLATHGNAMDVDGPMESEPTTMVSVHEGPQAGTNAGSILKNGDLPQEQAKQNKKTKHQSQDGMSAAAHSILPVDLTKEAETIMPEEVVSQDMGINKITPQEDSREEKAMRKEEKRKRKKTGLIQSQPNSQTREQPAQVPIPIDSSPQKDASTQGSQTKPQVSSQSTSAWESKEERAKRKEEKKKRRVTLDFH